MKRFKSFRAELYEGTNLTPKSMRDPRGNNTGVTSSGIDRVKVLINAIKAKTPLETTLGGQDMVISHVLVDGEKITQKNLTPTFLRTALEDENYKKKTVELMPVGKTVPISISRLIKTPMFGGQSGRKAEVSAKETGKVDSTKMEGNIIYGLLYHTDPKAAESRLAKYKKMGSPPINLNAIESGKKIAEALQSTFGSISTGENETFLASGGRVDSKLSPLYLRYGVSSTEPKTDLIVNKKFKCSVKNRQGSQAASAQAGEAAAIWSSALDNGKGIPKILKPEVIGDYLYKTMSKPVFYGARGKGKDKTKFQRALTKTMGIKSGDMSLEDANAHIENKLLTKGTNNLIRKSAIKDIKNNPPTPKYSIETALYWYADKYKLSKTERTKLMLKSDREKKNIANAAKQEMIKEHRDKAEAIVNAAFVPLSEKVSEALQDSAVKVAVYYECLTGDGKFVNDEPKANYVLKWDHKSPDTSTAEKLNDSWVKKHLSSVNFVINDRGGRGGAFRVTQGLFKEESSENQISSLCTGVDVDAILNEVFEDKSGESALLAEELYDSWFIEALNEGWFSDLKSAATKGWEKTKSTAKEVGKAMATLAKQAWQQLKEAAKKLMKFMANLVAKVITGIKKLAKYGAGVVMGALGYDIENLDYSYN